MLRKIRERIQNEESGFTLIELLVVILIIGILAAIALPAFLGQQKKGQDAAVKSDVRNAVSQMETCYANTQDYGDCDAAEVKKESTGIDIVDGAPAEGQVGIISRDRHRLRAEGSVEVDEHLHDREGRRHRRARPHLHRRRWLLRRQLVSRKQHQAVNREAGHVARLSPLKPAPKIGR